MGDRDDDERLIAAAKGGDRSAIETLLERHQQQVYAFGRRMCRNAEDAKDVTQDTLLAATRAIGDFQGSSKLSTWLFTIARRFCIRRQERDAARPLEPASMDRAARTVADARPDPAEAAESKELHEMVEDALDALEPNQREAFILRDVEGMTAPEVAEVLGVRVEAVKSRLHRARSAIRTRLAPLLAEDAVEKGHLDIERTFSAYLEGEITPAVCHEMEHHLLTCTPCQSKCDALKRALALCQAAPRPQLSAAEARSIHDALRAFLDERR
jgi:RNA polymerase sigma-70 factor (ECF subfamily)